ncbi:MAG: hypothetical protein ACK4UN_02620 [Limisphaerales bacterium]
MPDKLSEFLAQHDWELLKNIKGWHVERDDESTDVIRLTLPARDGEQFTVRFVCIGYPNQAPSVKFVNASGSEADRTAWPTGTPAFHEVVKLPPHSFLCTDLTLEGFKHHPDWVSRSNAWKAQTHTLMDIFNYVHDILHGDHYKHRTL